MSTRSGLSRSGSMDSCVDPAVVVHSAGSLFSSGGSKCSSSTGHHPNSAPTSRRTKRHGRTGAGTIARRAIDARAFFTTTRHFFDCPVVGALTERPLENPP